MSSVSVHIRLPVATWERYSDEAQAARKSLAEYLRDVLDRQTDIASELFELRAMIGRQSANGNDADLAATLEALRDAAKDSDGMLPGDRAIALETLLLLREIAGPARTKPIQGSVEWEGLPVWRGSRI